MIALLLKSLGRKKKRKKKLGLVRSSEKDGSLFCQHQPYGAKAAKTSIEEEEKGLGSRTIKLWAAVCCVNQERPNSGLL